MTMNMRPAYLGDAKLGDTIRFDLPATGGGTQTFEGTVWSYERDNTHRPQAIVRFILSGHLTRGYFTCRPDLHIDLAA